MRVVAEWDRVVAIDRVAEDAARRGLPGSDRTAARTTLYDLRSCVSPALARLDRFERDAVRELGNDRAPPVAEAAGQALLAIACILLRI